MLERRRQRRTVAELVRYCCRVARNGIVKYTVHAVINHAHVASNAVLAPTAGWQWSFARQIDVSHGKIRRRRHVELR